ncbi:MAG TPA: phospholipase D-like domain-containing protein [Solirubrobacterales bacterium]|jgi:phosphatidylserine/phosphatidylglycerophosphate/cardiolipin synthase-like enzyme
MGARFEATGGNDRAPFTLKVRRGEGMALVSMDWREGEPPDDFVGFEIERKEPKVDFRPLRNRIAFPTADGKVDPKTKRSDLSPFQKFRWVDFPSNPEVEGEFEYRVTPVFMDAKGALSYGEEAQTAAVVLGGDTYPELNVAFTRGFVSSQAFVDRFADEDDSIADLIPEEGAEGLTFKATNPKAEEAWSWMGFEARRAILGLLDEALVDPDAQVRVVAYDFNLPELVDRLEKLGDRVKVIIDDSVDEHSKGHGEADSAESQAATRLKASAGVDGVKRQHMASLQHNKTIVVSGPKAKGAVCGSTNLSWRGFFVQSNNAVVLREEAAIEAFIEAFDSYWDHSDDAAGFAATGSAEPIDLKLEDIDAHLTFSPHSSHNAQLAGIAADIDTTESSLLYSLAFLSQTPGKVRNAIQRATDDDATFVYGVTDKGTGGIEVHKPDGNVLPASPAALTEHVPEPFKSEPKGGGGARMHHKFVVIDFDKPTARVHFGSYNFSISADTKNGENLLLIRDRRIATSYAIEALRIFDHYHFRVVDQEAKDVDETLTLKPAPSEPGEEPWWKPYYTTPAKIRDREVFA